MGINRRGSFSRYVMTVGFHLAIDATKASVRVAITDIARFAWAYDPEGNKVELWEPKG